RRRSTWAISSARRRSGSGARSRSASPASATLKPTSRRWSGRSCLPRSGRRRSRSPKSGWLRTKPTRSARRPRRSRFALAPERADAKAPAMTKANENQAGAPGPAPVSRPFLGLFALAHLGAFIAFVPMLNLLLPLEAECVDPAGKAVLLSQVMLWGAVAAAVTNLAAGTLSDATRGRFGRRRPWIVVGALAVAGAHGLVFAASTAQQLLVAV